jgi:hypothetical protein
MFTEERANKSNPADILVSVFLAESQTFGEVCANHVSIENLDPSTPPIEFFRYQFGQRRFAGARQAGEPQRESSVIHVRSQHPFWRI